MNGYSTDNEKFFLRKANKEDSELILKMIYEMAEYEKLLDEVIATKESIEESIFENNRAEAFIAELDGKVAGYLIYHYNYSTFVGREGLYVEEIFIRNEYRGMGLGTEIFKVIAKIARENKCKRVDWCCLDWNKPAQNFYEGLGAKAMDGWMIYRLKEDGINKL